MRTSGFGDQWRQKRQRMARLGSIAFGKRDGRLHIITPRDEVFRVRMRELGAQWKVGAQVWSLLDTPSNRRDVADAIESVFGGEHVPDGLRNGPQGQL